MRIFRKIIFWMHLTAALITGVVIFIMCVTGALLAFERNITEFAERDARYVAPSAGAQKLMPQQIVEAFKAARPEAKPSGMSISNEPNAAWLINLGREGQAYVDPYTGAITGEGSKTVRGAMNEFRNWHRYVALSGDQRPVGKILTGVSNIVFLFLAISGVYIWMPRKLNWKLVKPVIWFRRGLRGKARNFNWHNVIGFWSSLFLIIFTLTATVISFQWASNLILTLTGNEMPQQSAPPNTQQPPAEQAFVIPENLDATWNAAAGPAPNWKTISLRLPIEKNSAVFTIDEGIYWNIFGRSTLTLDATTAAVTKWDRYGERNSAQQLRTWFRFLHTGESGGTVGQIIGFIACVGGTFLVWTGFSLAIRRFGKWMKNRLNANLPV